MRQEGPSQLGGVPRHPSREDPTVMMTQEEFMDVKRMHDEGMTFVEIADATGYHRTTIAKWVRAVEPPEKRAAAVEPVVITDVLVAAIAGR